MTFRYETEATPELVVSENPDALIIAAGSRPLLPPLPGVERENVILVNAYYLKKEHVKAQVIVLGGGLAGCEIAIHLAREGKQVTLIEMRHELAADANVRHRPLLLQELSDQNVQIQTGLKGLEIIEEGVVCEDTTGHRQTIQGQTVILALGLRSRCEVVEALRDSAPYVRVIGDCHRVASITEAVYEGYHAALDI